MFVVIETEVGVVDNIHMIVKKINATHFHEEESLISFKAVIPSTVNTLNKIIIARYVYKHYLSNYFMMTVMLNLTTWILVFCVKERLDKLEHSALITEWTSNMEGNAYKKQAK